MKPKRERRQRRIHGCAIATFAAYSLITLGCVRGEVNEAAGRELSNQIVNYMLTGKLQDAYDKTEAAYKRLSSEASFEADLQKVLGPCGRPEGLIYTRTESGIAAEYEGSLKPYRKYYYDFANPKDSTHACYVAIQIVPEGDHLAVNSIRVGKH